MKLKLGVSFALNCLIFLMAAIGFIFALVGVNMTGATNTDSGIIILRMFTVQSNLLMGLAALIMLVFEFGFASGKIGEIPPAVYAIKLALTSGVTLTFFVVLIFLAPNVKEGYFSVFTNTNLFYHLMLPVISIISFLFFENTKTIKFSQTIWGLAHLILYMVFYLVNGFMHVKKGVVEEIYDWYGFLRLEIWSIPISAVTLIAMCYGITCLLWRANKKLSDFPIRK